MDQPAKNERKTEQPITESSSVGSSAGIIILQWLTYALWGWTLLSLVWLIFIVVANFVTNQDISGMVPYAIAASLVLLPISVICDVIYTRYEPVKKQGASMVVMVIHAVIFALFGIGMLISGVLVLVQMAIGSTDASNSGQITWIITALSSTALYAVMFLRTLNPMPKLRLARWFPVLMSIVVIVFIVLGFVGPAASARLVRDDNDIANNISSVSQGVNDYVSSNNRLPSSLSQLNLSGTARSIVDRQLVTYKALPSPTAAERLKDLSESGTTKDSLEGQQEYRYQLCTTYKKESSYYSSDYNDNREEYVFTPFASSHPAGKVCYKLKSVTYN
jgi:hypothetical protein